MRQIIPQDISKTNLSHMSSQGIPSEIASRLWNTKVLWLICMHPDDIFKVRIMGLRFCSVSSVTSSVMFVDKDSLGRFKGKISGAWTRYC